MYLGRNIRYLRKKRGLGQDDLAELFNYRSYTTIQKWESGVSEPSAGVTQKLASFFNVSMDDLVNVDFSVERILKGHSEYPFISQPIAPNEGKKLSDLTKFPLINISDTFLGKYARRKDIIIMTVYESGMDNIIGFGSIVAFLHNKPIQDLKNNDIVVSFEKYYYSLRRFYKTEDKIILKPESSDEYHIDSVYSIEDEVPIVGKVVMYSIKLE